ncbi:MAG: hypothetical protein CMD18_06565 [Flavobacteriales bacterium]|nr:hypothetical protein [Flavobacteriales bacterium]
MNLEVLHPGFNTTIQDSGRINGLAYGVPRGGAMDLNLMYLANKLVGNSRTNAVLEFTMKGGKYRFDEDSIIAYTGLGFAEVNSRRIEVNSRVCVKKNDILTLSSCKKGRYNYLAIQGKIEADEFWGSYSTYELVKKGGFKGRKLQKEDVISISKGFENNFFYESNNPESPNIRVLRAPEFDHFPKNDHKRFVQQCFTVSSHSNRMGYRLNEAVLKGTKTGNIVSSGCIPGTIQVPSSGAPIVLMADSPTTGGYPRIGVIHPDDFGFFAQKMPGEIVKFEWFEF